MDVLGGLGYVVAQQEEDAARPPLFNWQPERARTVGSGRDLQEKTAKEAGVNVLQGRGHSGFVEGPPASSSRGGRP